MRAYEQGDYIKVAFEDAETGESEWMWVRVESADDAKRVVFGYLDSEPVLGHHGKLKLGSLLAVSYDNVLQHKKASELQIRNETTGEN